MTFEAALLAATGEAGDPWDIRAVVRRCWLYDFDGYPTRLWHGMGVLHAGGQDWIGTIAPDGRDHHRAPAVKDGRDGSSPRYEFGIPYVDKATFDALKADQALALDRRLTCWRVLLLPGEGLRATTPLRFSYRLTMKGVEAFEGVESDGVTRRRSLSVVCRSGEEGRSRTPGGTYTDASQRERARLLGVGSDSGCAFVAALASRTYTIEGG